MNKIKLFRWYSRRFQIAVVTLDSSDLLLGEHAAVLKVLDEHLGPSYVSAYASGEGSLPGLRKTTYDLFKRYRFDVILSIGRAATKATQKALAQRKRNTPVIFGGIIDPVGNGFVASEEDSRNNLTGVRAIKRDYAKQVKLFLELGLAVKRMVVVQSSLDYEQNARELDRAVDYLMLKGIEVKRLILKETGDFRTTLKNDSSKPDVIMLSHDSLVARFAPQIIEYCNKNKVVLFASDPETVKQGASIGYCDPERSIGSLIAKKSLEILCDNKTPREIPITTVEWSGKFIFNQAACALQGIVRDLS